MYMVFAPQNLTLSLYSLCRYNRKAGYVPSMYLKLYNSPSFGLQSLQRKLYSSTMNLSTNNSFKLEPQACLRNRMNSFLNSNSLEMLSEPQSPNSYPVQHEEFGSFSDDGTDFSFSSSDTTSMSPSMSSSEGDEGLRPQDKEPDSVDMSSGQSSPTSSDTGHPMKGVEAPRVPPRPQFQEILRRCTSYTRKAALATSARIVTNA